MINTAQIRLVLFGVDGVLTDGALFIGPDGESVSLLGQGMALRLRYLKSIQLWLGHIWKTK